MPKSLSNTFAATISVMALLAGCGGTSPAPESAPPAPAAASSEPAPTTPPAAESAPPATEPAPVAAPKPEYPPFDSLTPAAKLDHMKKVVTPKMKELFLAFDAKEFANFSCATCHGAGAKSGNFHMPNASLPKLDFSDGGAKMTKAHPEAMKFMGEQVSPTMAKLLGEEPYNHETGKGFGCFGCHEGK